MFNIPLPPYIPHLSTCTIHIDLFNHPLIRALFIKKSYTHIQFIMYSNANQQPLKSLKDKRMTFT